MGGVAAALARGTGILAGGQSPRPDAALLLACALERSRDWIVAHPDDDVDEAALARYVALCARRSTGMPLAYVLGRAGFYGREFEVDESVLVPRPETEHLVDEALLFLRQRALEGRESAVLDVGTGSGAIACTIAAQSQNAVDATDASPAALDVAARNARRLGVARLCRFFCGDLMEPVASRRYDLIVANLPYLPTRDLPAAPDPVSFEPAVALDGGPDGLDCYRRLLQTAPAALALEGLLLLEAAPPTMPALETLVRAAFPGAQVAFGNDYAGLARYLRCRQVRGASE